MELYKLTKGSVSCIRTDAAGVAEAEADGFVLEGKCGGDYVVTEPGARPKAPEPPKAPKNQPAAPAQAPTTPAPAAPVAEPQA